MALPNRDPKTGRFTAGSSGSSGGGGFNLGTAYGQIVLSADTSALAGVQSTLQGLFSGAGGAFSSIGSTLTGIGGGLTALTAPLAVAGKTGIDTAANFDMLMKQIEMFGNVAPENLDTVRQFAIQMGADTMFSANDAAGALLGLLKAGFGLEDAMAMLQPTMEMATVGQLSLGQASAITVAAMSQFSLQAGDAARVSDLLARGAGASGADVLDLGQALTNVGGIAHQWGLSIEDTIAVLGIMANNGIKGADAGTMLKSTLLNLYRPTKEVKETLGDLGVTLANADGTLKPFNQVLGELDAALSALPIDKQNEAMYILGGSYGIMGLSTLRAAGGLDAMKTAMNESKSASEIAAAMMETFWGRVESLKGSIESLMLEVIQPFMNDVLAPLVAQVIGVVNGITKWVQANPQLAGQIMRILALVTVAGPVLLGLGLVFSSVGSILKGFGVVVGALSSPLGLIIAAVGALAWAFDTNFLGIRDLLAPVLENIGNLFENIVGVLGRFGEIVSSGGLMDGLNYLLDVLMFDVLGLDQNSPIFQFVQNLVTTLTQGFQTIVMEIGTNVLPVLQSLYDWFVTTALPAIVNFVQTVVIPGIQAFIDTLGRIWSVVAPGLQAVWDWFTTSALPTIVNFVRAVVIPAVEMFIGAIANIWNAIAPALQQFWDWFMTTGLPAIRDFIVNEVLPRITDFINLLSGIWTTISPALQSVLDWFTLTALPAVVDFVTNTVLPAVQDFIDMLTGMWMAVSPYLEDFKKGIEAIFNWIKINVIDPIVARVQEFITKLQELKGIADRISASITGGLNAWQGIGQNAQAAGALVQSGQVTPAQYSAALNQAIGDEIRSTGVNAGNALIRGGAGIFNAFMTLARGGSRDSGGEGLPGVPYLIGRGAQPELFVPSTPGTFYPNGGGGMGGTQIQSVVIHASTYEGGVAAARGFQEELMRLSEARGAA